MTETEIINYRNTRRKIGEYDLSMFPAWVKTQRMANDFVKKSKEYKDMCLKKLSEVNTIKDIEYLVKLCGFSKTVFYEYLQVKSDYYNEVKDAIQSNKANLAQNLFAKMYTSDNPALTAMAFKLVCSEEDLEKVSLNNNKHSGEINHNHGVMSGIKVQMKVHSKRKKEE